MQKILIAVDGSDQSMRAVKTGSEIAAKFGAKIYLLNVVRQPELPEHLRQFAESEHLSGGSEAVLHQAAKYVLSNAEELVRKSGCKDVEVEVKVGPIARTIARYAKNTEVDLIVMGRRGLGAGVSSKMDEISEVLLGGITRRVGVLANCSCLTVT